jgi:hypothetical protein
MDGRTDTHKTIVMIIGRRTSKIMLNSKIHLAFHVEALVAQNT